MRYVSTFSGIEAASVAWESLGWEPMAFCEIDEFPSAVLRHHYPDVPNLGDVTKVDWKEFVSEHGRPDVVVGGSPCQSFSVAGGRDSLDGESRLMFEYIRACDEIRSPWIVWENVPGVLNTRDNAFAQLLDSLQDIGYVSLAWRVLDAQFFGVAQRRRRVFLVGHLGAGGGASAVLFESESVRGNTQTSKQKREELARAARGGSSSGGSAGFCGYASSTARSIGYSEEMSPTLKGNDWQTQVPDVLHATARVDVVRSAGFKYHQGSRARSIGYLEEQSPTLIADYHQPAIAIQTGHTSANGSNVNVEDLTYTLSRANDQAVMCMTQYGDNLAGTHDGGLMTCPICGADAMVVVDDPQEPERFWGYGCGCTRIGCKNYARSRKTFDDVRDAISDWNSEAFACYAIDYKQTPKLSDGLCHTLTHEGSGGIHSAVTAPSDDMSWVVRRLTPVECERLQGFPDNWTDVPFKGSEHPTDTPRYKAIGNSMAVPVMRWIGERIEFVERVSSGLVESAGERFHSS